MRQSKVIVITGGIGTGKSLVSKYLLKKRYVVIDFDLISREIYNKGRLAYSEILKSFGNEILNEKNEIDRVKLGKLVFNDSSKLEMLNNITHKFIFQRAKEMISKHQKEALIFLDIPLYYEVKSEIEKFGIKADEVWLVYSDKNLQIERVMKRDNLSFSEALKRIDAQIPVEKKVQYADKVLYNLHDERELYRQVEELLDLNKRRDTFET